MSIKRGKRRSVILETTRWRLRLVVGRFRRFGFEYTRDDVGKGGCHGLIAGRFFLLTFWQYGYR